MATKPINKSVRISEQVYDIIQAYPGEGFNNKFESMVLEAFVSENERRKTLKELDKQIASAEKELRDVKKKISTGMNVVDRLNAIRHQLDNLDRSFQELNGFVSHM